MAPSGLAGTGLLDYADDLATEIETLSALPVLVGHSMGGLLAQMLAARGLARALVLVTPSPPSGILPTSEDEIAAARGLMSLGPFWNDALVSDFDIARGNSLTHIPPDNQRDVFEHFVPESGRAIFEAMFWMFDATRASAVDASTVRCPVLCLAADGDKVVAPTTVEKITERYNATYLLAYDHGHMLPFEPGSRHQAERVLDWLSAAA